MTQPPIPEGETIREAAKDYFQNNPNAFPGDYFIAGSEWQKAQAGGEWISVETALPENGQTVMVVTSHNPQSIQFATYRIRPNGFSFERYVDITQGERLFAIHYSVVTHWLPLPEPPTPQ